MGFVMFFVFLRGSSRLQKIAFSKWERRFGAREHMLPVFWTKFKKSKKIQKITKKIMHVPQYATHHRDKFRTEKTSYAPWRKKDKFLTANSNFRISFAVRNLSFLPRAHTMTFRGEICHDDAHHAQVRA